MTNLSNVQQALLNAELAQKHWIDGGYEALSNQLEEELRKEKQVIDVYPYVEIDISVDITIVLLDKTYKVPLEDVSAIHVNNCLTISAEDLYPDWEEKVKTKIEASPIGDTRFSRDSLFIISTFLGADGKVRTLKKKVA